MREVIQCLLPLRLICFWKALEQTRPSMTLVNIPDTMVDLPITMVDLPNTMADLPNTMVDLPNTVV